MKSIQLNSPSIVLLPPFPTSLFFPKQSLAGDSLPLSQSRVSELSVSEWVILS